MKFRRLYPCLLTAAGLLATSGCERRPYGVDFSVDHDYDFGSLRRVAIIDPPEPGRAAGLDRVLVDAASDALGQRFMVVYGNRLRTAVQAAQVEEAYLSLRRQLADGRDPDAGLLRQIARAIGVDGFYVTELAAFERRHEPDFSYTTVQTSTSSGFASAHQSNRSAAFTTVRLTARLYDAATGLSVWSGSKFQTTTDSIESRGLKPLFRSVSEDFLLTLPPPAGASAAPVMRMSR